MPRLVRSVRRAIILLSAVIAASLVGVASRGHLPGEGSIPVQVTTEAPSGSLCIAVPLSSGRVSWRMSSPESHGYSIDDEAEPSALRWPSGSTEPVDAVYRTSWGCRRALKIPDSCAASIGSGDTYECCCNGLLSLLGYNCTLIDPSQDPYFSDCPLQEPPTPNDK